MCYTFNRYNGVSIYFCESSFLVNALLPFYNTFGLSLFCGISSYFGFLIATLKTDEFHPTVMLGAVSGGTDLELSTIRGQLKNSFHHGVTC